MRTKFGRMSMAFIAFVVISKTLSIHACPYCPPTEATLSEKQAESDVVCVAKYLSIKDGPGPFQQTTKFDVIKILVARTSLKKGETIEMPFGVTAKAGDLFLFMGQVKQETLEWNLPIPIDELGSEVSYLQKAPSIDRPQSERLSYFLKYLDNKNPTISNDAFGEFAKAQFEDVAQLAPEISRMKVREWLEDPNPQLEVRRAFYGMLLGLCGNEDDATFLEKKMFAPIDPEKNRLGIEGLMGGYLLLRGQPGLRLIVEKIIDALPPSLAVDDPRIGDLNALRMTLSFLWDYRRVQFTETPLRVAMRRFLARPEFADLAVKDLARWKDWESLDSLILAYGKEPWETRSAQEQLVAFALSCRKDVPANSDAELPVHAAKAQKFLDGLDPKFVESVRRTAVGRIPLPKPSTEPKANAKNSDG